MCPVGCDQQLCRVKQSELRNVMVNHLKGNIHLGVEDGVKELIKNLEITEVSVPNTRLIDMFLMTEDGIFTDAVKTNQ